MYDKITTFEIISSKPVFHDDLLKTAAVENLPEPYDPDFLYIWVRSISAGEYWGSNKNADFFAEREIANSYQTFLDAHVFKNHDNKDVAKAIGSVIKAIWNPKMKCVELLIKIDRKLAPEIVRSFSKGTATDVSMGCRVSHTICSYCGNVAKTRAEFCQHVRTMRNQIMPDGKKVFEYNIGPRFHDISVVLNGADKTAKVLEIVAGEEGFEKAASDMTFPEPIAETSTSQIVLDNPTTMDKRAAIQKEILDKLYTIGIISRDTEPDAEEVLEKLLEMSREAGVAVAIELEKCGSMRDVRNIAIGTTGVALATNYLQGKRLRGQQTTEIENFIADNPGVLPIAYAIAGYPAYKGLKKRIKILKQAGLSIDNIVEDYTNLFTKEASSFNLEVNGGIDIFRNENIDTQLCKTANISKEQCNMVKAAVINYGAGREDLVNIAKEKYHITDDNIGSFLKLSYDAICEDIEKEANIGRGIVEATLANPTGNRGIQTGLTAPIIAASILDGYLIAKLFNPNKPKKDKPDDVK